MPPGVHKRPFYYFHCPSCGLKSSYARPVGRGWRNPLFWCEACGKYSRQKRLWLVSSLWGVTAGLIATTIWFGPFYSLYFEEPTALRLAAPLAGLAVALAVWPIFGRLFLRYERDPDGHT